MHPLLLPLRVLWLLPLAWTQKKNWPLVCIPRRSLPYHRDSAHLFHEKGVFNYSTMLLREDLDLLLLGAREAVYALDLKDISKKISSVKWEVTQEQKTACQNKGKDIETDCKNFIRVLHQMMDDRIYVCGTNAFDPACDYMSYANETLTLEKKVEDGKGKCPFSPSQRFASIMVENVIISAIAVNSRGTKSLLMRHSPNRIRTEFTNTCFKEPNFVSLTQIPESYMNEEGDDDKIYLFFSELAVEYDCYKQLVVSRVARVCKGDLGGQLTMQKKWTSFLKVRIDCPVLESQVPYIIQNTYRLCDPPRGWRDCWFYAIFTPQSDTSDLSAVCAYRLSDISEVFAKGRYKKPVHIEGTFVKWVEYRGEVPVPRPGACIDNTARKMGITQTLKLPDRTLQFIRERPLMDQPIKPIGDKPLVVRRGARFTCIVVNEVQAADGKKYRVMFIGTEKGTIVKAVNYDGEMFIVEEVQLFQTPEPIKILTFSNVTGKLYAGSDYGAAQVPLATCGRSSSCMDCVLSRDPYCGWDKDVKRCVFLSDSPSGLIQNVTEGDAALCPDADPVKPMKRSIWPKGKLKLPCLSPSYLSNISWVRGNDVNVTASTRFQLLRDGLLILNAASSDTGRYRCLSVERSRAGTFTTTVAEYQVRMGPAGPSMAGLQASVGLLVVSLLALLTWNFNKGHLSPPWKFFEKHEAPTQETRQQGGRDPRVSFSTFQYIYDESEV